LVVVREHEHLRLAGQSPERTGVQDAISVAFEARAPLIGRLGLQPVARPVASGGVERQLRVSRASRCTRST
jgi:hypothetical protein